MFTEDASPAHLRKLQQPDTQIKCFHPDVSLNGLCLLNRGLVKEAEPLVENIRSKALGLYEHHLRPHIGPILKEGIDNIKVILDEVLPTEKTA